MRILCGGTAMLVLVLAVSAGTARADTIHLAQAAVDVTPPSGTWQADTDVEGGTTFDRITGTVHGTPVTFFLTLTVDTQTCAELLAAGNMGTLAMSPPFVPSKFDPHVYLAERNGEGDAAACVRVLDSANLLAIVHARGSFASLDADTAAGIRDMLAAIAGAIDNPPPVCVTDHDGVKFWLPEPRWMTAEVDGAPGMSAVARIAPAKPFTRILYKRLGPDEECTDNPVPDTTAYPGSLGWGVQHANYDEKDGRTHIYACGNLAAGRGGQYLIVVEGSVHDVPVEVGDILDSISEGLLNGDATGGCRGTPTAWKAPVAPTPTPTVATPDPTPDPTPTEVATAEPPPPGDDSGADTSPPPPAAEPDETATSDDEEPDRSLRPTIALAIAHSESSVPMGASANGAAIEIEAMNYGERDGLASAAEITLGLGWTAGVDFDARGGLGFAYRVGPVAVATVAGVGVDGYGTVEDGAELHSAGALAYVGAHARIALGRVIVDGNATWGSRTGGDEARYEGALSWQPRGATGYGVGATSLSLDGKGSATFVWVGVYPR